jgi:hypothetical protein
LWDDVGSRFSLTVPLNRNGSWGIIANLDLKLKDNRRDISKLYLQ